MATIQIQRCKNKRVKVHIYILYIEYSWANSHIMVALKKESCSKAKEYQMKKLFTKWRHKNISKHYLDLCAIRVFVSVVMSINTSVFQLHVFGFEYRVLEHYETLTSTLDHKILRKRGKTKRG